MKNQKFRLTFNMALLFILILLFITIACLNSAFLSFDYIIGVMIRNIIELGLLALPVTLIIITGGIDLSVGSTMVLAAMSGGLAAVKFGSTAGIIVTLLTGLLCGLFNGFVIAKLKISPLVTTLATMFLYMGIARGMSLGDSVYSYPATQFLGNTDIGGFPLQAFLYAAFAVVFYLILSKTTLGRELFAIGLNENAAKYSGIKTERKLILIYVISGLMCALASMIWLGRFTSIKYDAGTSIGLKVVTIIVLGGTSILGGLGDIKGTIIATFIIAVLNSGLTVLNIPIDSQTIVNGSVLVISLITYAILTERIKKSRIIKLDSTV
ncbi:MAG TPA: ABC transporter permease [Ruminiclostridium sp.]